LKIATKPTYDMKKLILLLFIPLVFACGNNSNKEEEKKISTTNEVIEGNEKYYVDEIKFDNVKNARFQEVIKKLEDIRMAQLAHETVTDSFANDWDKLVRFIETDSLTITEKIDMRIPDKQSDRLYGMSGLMKDTVIIKFLRNVSVRDSLFGSDERYKRMMYVPFAQSKDEKFKLETNFIEREVGSNITYLPAFEVSVEKSIVLFDQPENLVKKENEILSVDGVNGPTIKLGSLNEPKTDGNWPKNYIKK